MKLLFPNGGYSYANCLIFILTIYTKYLLFQCLGCGIRMAIPILTGVQNGRVSLPKNNLMLKKNFFLLLYFRDEGHLCAKCLFDILTTYPKCHRFNFFSRGIHMYISILTGVQNGRISRLKDSVFLAKNVLFEASFPWWRSLVCQLLKLYSDYLP